MASIYVTRPIPESGITMLRDAGHAVVVSEKDGVLEKDELISALRAQPFDAVLCLLTDTIDAEVFDAAPQAKIFANYAVGFDNIDVAEAARRGIVVTNTPGVLTDCVAEHTIALMLSVTSRIAEGDRYVRAGKYDGWAPMLLLGTDLKEKTLGVVGLGRIGSRVAHIASRGLGMKIAYYDIAPNADFEKEYGAVYYSSVDGICSEADVISVHVPLLPATEHLINAERLSRMKPNAYLINTSRGPVIDEQALVEALQKKQIRGAGLDVFEHEPALAPGLAELENVVLTPHIASASDEVRSKMSEMAAENILAVLSGQEAPNRVAV